VGEAAILSVEASVGTGILSDQWYSNTIYSNSGGTVIDGATSSSYAAPTAEEGTTYYYCVITNTDNTVTGNTTATTTSNAVSVVVNELVTTPAAITITTTSLPNGTVNRSYSKTLEATGGTEPYTWSAAGLPEGLDINTSTGEIHGIPEVAGTFSVTATVYDGYATPKGNQKRLQC
jgi:hypothetical protein